MNDSYIELLVKRKESTGALAAKSVLYALGILFLLLFLLTHVGVAVLIALLFALAGFLVQSQCSNIEYEYLVLEKTFSIDQITNQSKRKQVAEYDLTQLELMAPLDSERLDRFKNNPQVKIKDYSSRSVASKPYAMFFRKGESWEQVLVETTEELLEHLSKILPRKVFKD